MTFHLLPHWVYVHWGHSNQVLYIGATCNLKQRKEEHARDTAWIGEVTRVQVFGPFSKRDARLTERTLIRVLAPLYNLHHNPRNQGLRTSVPNGAPNAERSAAIRALVRAHRGLPA